MIVTENVSRIYRNQRGEVRALDGVNFTVKEGEFAVVRGPSGSGKSTLLLTIGGMIHPTNGGVEIGGQNIYAMTAQERARFRAANIGFVFQMFHLVPYLNVVENVLLSSAAGTKRAGRGQAEELLTRLGLSGRMRHRPSELSAGEKQRTALARALLNSPKVLLADEPTGNLDPENAGMVLDHISHFHKNGGTVILVTHENVAADYADRMIRLENGRIQN